MIFRKTRILILTIILTPILAGVYGVLHDQLSYTISPEYFTKFKFEQFGFENIRTTVAIIGFWATWWTGLLIGVVNGIIGLIQPTPKIMWKSIYGASIRILGIAIGFGLLGVLVGKFIISEMNTDWNIPNNVNNRNAFLTVGTMYGFSYFGGLVGLIFGTIYQLRLKNDVV